MPSIALVQWDQVSHGSCRGAVPHHHDEGRHNPWHCYGNQDLHRFDPFSRNFFSTMGNVGVCLNMPWPVNEDPGDETLLLEGPSEGDQLEAAWKTLKGEDAPPPTEIPRMTKEELRKFVLDVLSGAVFVSDQVRRMEDIGHVFLPVLFGALSDWDREALKQIGILWEYNNKALPRGINGMPMFTSCRMMHVEDWKRARLAIAKEQQRQKEIDV